MFSTMLAWYVVPSELMSAIQSHSAGLHLEIQKAGPDQRELKNIPWEFAQISDTEFFPFDLLFS